jgi:hypothetical protein
MHACTHLCADSTFDYWTSLFQYLDLFLTRGDGLRRRFLLNGEAEDALNYSIIRETFQVLFFIFYLFFLPALKFFLSLVKYNFEAS